MCYTQPSSQGNSRNLTIRAELEEEQERELCPEAHSGSIYSTEANKHILTCG